MPLSPLAGKSAPANLLIDVEKLVNAYDACTPDLNDPQQFVSFGTSGHRGTSENGTFTEAHILAITQAICDYRTAEFFPGRLYCPGRAIRVEDHSTGAVWSMLDDGNGLDLELPLGWIGQPP